MRANSGVDSMRDNRGVDSVGGTSSLEGVGDASGVDGMRDNRGADSVGGTSGVLDCYSGMYNRHLGFRVSACLTMMFGCRDGVPLLLLVFFDTLRSLFVLDGRSSLFLSNSGTGLYVPFASFAFVV